MTTDHVAAIDAAVFDLNEIALANPGVADQVKAVAIRLRASVAPDLSTLLEESLGAGAGEVCS